MIKFFRKIRQNLLSEGKTGKYFKYAIGEIILVVIGILIALQINNWNEVRKTNTNQLKYLTLLKKEAESNIANIDLEMVRIKKMKEAQKEIFRLIDNAKDTLTEQYISQTFFSALSSFASFNYENSVLAEIKNSGELKNIKNNSLRLSLIELEPNIGRLKIQENALNILQKKILEYVNLNGDLRLILENTGYNQQLGIGKATAKSNGNKSLLNDDYFKNKVNEYMVVTFNLSEELYPRQKNQFIDVVNKINKEISHKK
jgi:hypothetical protein